MWFFDKKVRVTETAFIEDQLARIGEADYVDSLRNALRATSETLADEKLIMFRIWITLAAMSLAKLPEAVQRRFFHCVCNEAEQRLSLAWRQTLEGTLLEYMRTMAEDLGSERGAQYLPQTMSFALDQLVGKRDESVVVLRLILLKITHSILDLEAKFYRDLRII